MSFEMAAAVFGILFCNSNSVDNFILYILNKMVMKGENNK